jgi:trimeric autotransporter adhesin
MKNPRCSIPVLLLLAPVLFNLSAAAQSAPGDEHWDYRFGLPGVNGAITTIVSRGNEIYAGGVFTSIGNVAATDIAKWDGANWTALSGNMSTDSQTLITRIALGTNGDLYASGLFSGIGGVAATNLAHWDGTKWSPLGSGVSGGASAGVGAMAVSGNQLYVGGSFTNAGGHYIKNLARWDGTNWSAVGGGIEGGTNTTVNTLLLDGNNLYVGGNFTNAGGLTVNRIAKWDGTNWSALGSGLTSSNATVTAILKGGTNFYVSGSFTNAGGIMTSNIAKWDGTQWSALGSGVSTPITTMAVDGDLVYIGGRFNNAGGVTVTNVARWDGANWSNIGGVTAADPAAIGTDYIYTLAIGPGGKLLAGGYFSKAGSQGVQSLAQWDGTNWSSWEANNHGLSAAIYSLTANADALYAGGLFYTAGRTLANQVARWDGTNWSALGAGIIGKVPTIGRVAALTLNGSDLFVGGIFTNAGGITLSNIARWNGTNWFALGNGVNGNVLALASDGANVYAGGSFTTAGGNSTNRIAKWDGSSWTALETGMNNNVTAIAMGSDGIYVGGSFTTAGSVSANRIARWDGANWNLLGSGTTNGLGGNVTAIAVSGSTVYAGGNFTTAGGLPANMVAKWDGTTWTNLGTGIQGSTVYALAVIGSRLYVGGQFTTAGGLSTTNVACWDGSSWTTLGSGNSASGSSSPIGVVQALAAWNNDLYVAGSFQRIGQKPAFRICRWNDQTTFLPPTAMQLANPALLPDGHFQFRISASGGASYVLEATTNFTDWTPLLTNSLGAFDFADPPLPGLPLQFYRARQVP